MANDEPTYWASFFPNYPENHMLLAQMISRSLTAAKILSLLSHSHKQAATSACLEHTHTHTHTYIYIFTPIHRNLHCTKTSSAAMAADQALKPFRLLDLPREVRDRIYELHLVVPKHERLETPRWMIERTYRSRKRLSTSSIGNRTLHSISDASRKHRGNKILRCCWYLVKCAVKQTRCIGE